MKSSLIPSIIGQNDSYLAEFFLKRDYAAHRIVCHSSPFNTAGTDGHLSTIPWNFGFFYRRSAGQWRQTLLWLSIGHRHNHVIRTFCKMAFAELGMGLKWKDKGLNEKDTNRKSKKVAIAADSHFFRPIKMALLREGAPPCTYETETETSHELAPLAKKKWLRQLSTWSKWTGWCHSLWNIGTSHDG